MKVLNPPNARDLMVTARSFGSYDLASALSDLIDNSIKARATRIRISFDPMADDVVVRIRDDGCGMNSEELKSAMRPASADPELPREPEDLGRFGWGLKSASLSQARVLTVVSWKAGHDPVAARWDIDDIKDWSMGWFDGEGAIELIADRPETLSGTEVIWTRTDRLLDHGNGKSIADSLAKLIAQARGKISLTFHRYLAGENGAKLSIFINGQALDAVDPFLIANEATQTSEMEQIVLRGSTKDAVISVQPFVLPHYSKLPHDVQDTLGGAEGMIRNQGFYVYRNKRLIISGTWFGLLKHSELSQLTRIKVDLPNSVDEAWRITIDKSGAQLPAALRARLGGIARTFFGKSRRVYRGKGTRLRGETGCDPVWVRVFQHGHIRYTVNRDHPMVAALLAEAPKDSNPEQVLRLLEAYFPTESFIRDSSGTDHKLEQGLLNPEEFESLIDQCGYNYLQSCGESPTVAGFLELLGRTDPFSSQMKYVYSYVRQNALMKWGIHGK